MATVLRRRRIVNPGRRRRSRKNIGEIVAIGLAGNPGTRKHKVRRNNGMILTFGTKRKKNTGMARSRKGKLNAGLRRWMAANRKKNSGTTRRRRRRTNSGTHRRRSTYVARRRRTTRRVNSGHRRRVSRRRNSGYMVRRRRRNAGFVSGATGGITQALQIVGGAVLCNAISGYLPASLNSGIMSYIATAGVAMAQGAIASKVLKNPSLGRNLQLGGFVVLALRIVKDFMPSLGNPFAGMGILAPTSFYTPQVNLPNSMNQFQVPSAVMNALPAPQSNSMGRVMRTARVGRM